MREKYDVIEHLKGKRDTFAHKIIVHDSFIERRNHNHKTPQSELDRHEEQRDYYADARDMLEIAIDILTEKMG